MEHDFALKTKAKNQSKTKINTSESRCNTYVRKEYMANELGWEYGNQSVLHYFVPCGRSIDAAIQRRSPSCSKQPKNWQRQ